MPKPLLKPVNKQAEELSLLTRKKSNLQQKNTNKLEIDRLLRKKRSKEYMKVMTELDTGKLDNASIVKNIIDALNEEFPDIDLSGMLVGFVQKCYLGHPYEVHTFNIENNNIIHHYKIGERMPGELERARALANTENYAFIEVYTSGLKAIRNDGSVASVNF